MPMLETRLSAFDFDTDRDRQLATDINDEELDVLLRHSSGIYSQEHFEDIFSPLPYKYGIPAGYSLGLDNFTRDDGSRPYYIKSHKLGLTTWKDGYRYHQLDWTRTPADSLKDLIYRYLNIITTEQKPIAFFVPPNLRTHPDSKITRWEMEWCLTNEKNINQVYFVFGLYND